MALFEKAPLWTLAVLGGLLLWAGWPMSPFPFLLWIGLVPILVAEKRIAESQLPHQNRRFFGTAYLFLLVWNALTTWWVCYASVAGGLFAIFANALLQSMPLMAFRFTRQKLPASLAYFALVVYWVAFEYLHLNWDLSWSWLTLGNGLAYWPQLVQWYEYTGVLGGSVWILTTNLLFFRVITASSNETKKYWFATLACIVLPLAISAVQYMGYQTPSQTAEVVVVQPNIDPYTEKFDNSPQFIPLEKQIERFIKLSEQKITSKTTWLLWPETAVDALVNEDILDQEAIIVQIQENFLVRYPHIHLLTGITSYRVFRSNETVSATARYSEGVGHYDAYNTALHLQYGKPTAIYHKSKLVPGVEQLPYPAFFKFLMAFVIDLGGTSGGMGKQPERVAFRANNATVAPVICYESIYGDFVTHFITKGANFIGIITNDGWWQNTPGHRQHWAYASLRAIETRREIARSANTGISGFVNGRGDRLKATQYQTQDVLSANIALNEKQTLYTLWGDYIGNIAAIATAIFLILAFVKRKNK